MKKIIILLICLVLGTSINAQQSSKLIDILYSNEVGRNFHLVISSSKTEIKEFKLRYDLILFVRESLISDKYFEKINIFINKNCHFKFNEYNIDIQDVYITKYSKDGISKCYLPKKKAVIYFREFKKLLIKEQYRNTNQELSGQIDNILRMLTQG